MSLDDPWIIKSSEEVKSTDQTNKTLLEFEDNFEPSIDRLPDSDSYLESLERKLRKNKNNPSILQQLVEKREASMQHLLNDNSNLLSESDLELERSIEPNDLVRYIRPEQALLVAEIVDLVKHDQLDTQSTTEEEETTTYKSRITLPILITAGFMILNFRWEVEINIHTEHMIPVNQADDNSLNTDDEENVENEEDEYTIDDDNESEETSSSSDGEF